MNNGSFRRKLVRTSKLFNRWFYRTPERALEQAYEAALKIQAIEVEHFEGQIIDRGSQKHSVSVQTYFETERDKYLRTTKVRLSEFKASRSVIGLSEAGAKRRNGNGTDRNGNSWSSEDSETPEVILEKLRFIDEVIDRYEANRRKKETALVPVQESPFSSYKKPRSSKPQPDISDRDSSAFYSEENLKPKAEAEGFADSTSFVPRSIFGTIDRLRRELNPQAEQELVKSFRSSKTKTIVSLRFILLLILVPLLVHQIAKSFVVGPLVEQWQGEDPEAVFINVEMEENALMELKNYEEKLKFQNLLTGGPALAAPEIESKMQEKAQEIAQDYRRQGSNAVKNVFSDILSVAAFLLVLLLSKREIEILKSFIDEIIYGLSDSAKAFIIILFTDMFVGFHSPHGWEVILEGVARHLGLPENREFNFLFIATFPVILDTVFKYWIFRYLNRISPSAVATYHNMNE